MADERTEQWGVQLRIESGASTHGIAAAPHYYDYYDYDDEALEKRNVTVHNRVARLDAHTHIQRRKKNLMLLKCTISGVARAVIPPKPSPTISDMDMQTALLYCSESMFTKDKKIAIDDECLRGDSAVLKVRQPAADFQLEGSNMLRMLENDAVAALMPPVHAFLKFDYCGQTWGGMCTAHYDWCVNMIIYPGCSAIGKLEADFAKKRPFFSSPTTIENNVVNRGVPVRFSPGRTLQTAVIAACMELLQRMHAAGWVHGDTHLGNFMLDSTRWRVVAIDVERAFESRCPRQHLLDMQELFGHASGLLVARPCTSMWDMRDVLGVMVRLHPGAQRKRCKRGINDSEYDALRLLPMCLCFTCDKASERIEGCHKCNTSFFDDIVAHYASNPRSYIKSMLKLSLEHVAELVAEARSVSHAALRSVADPLLPLIHTLPALRKQTLYADVLPDVSSTDGRAHFDEWVSDMLFLGVIQRSDDTRKMVDALRKENLPETHAVADQMRTAALHRI